MLSQDLELRSFDNFTRKIDFWNINASKDVHSNASCASPQKTIDNNKLIINVEIVASWLTTSEYYSDIFAKKKTFWLTLGHKTVKTLFREEGW